MEPLSITAYSMVNALGVGAQASLEALQRRRGGLCPCDFEDAALNAWIGRVDGVEDVTLPGHLAKFACRNNRLAQMGLTQDGFADRVAEARHRYGASRIGVFVGTSTSGIRQTERAYRARNPDTGALPTWFRYRYTHNIFSVADLARRLLQLQGPAQAVSTACSSSAKVFGTAYRHIQAGFCDAAVVGGVDSLCLTTLYGFNSLEVVSSRPCRPWDVARNGISVGEAAGFALLERARPDHPDMLVLGYGESVDAYHMSTPHPEGLGAKLAMERALASAGLSAAAIDYINLHGTATAANDATEDLAVVSVFGTNAPCSSTKGWTGHTLGAAGITEILLTCLAVEHGFIPGTLNTELVDPSLGAAVQLDNRRCALHRAISNSFGFGGNNCSVVVGRGY